VKAKRSKSSSGARKGSNRIKESKKSPSLLIPNEHGAELRMVCDRRSWGSNKRNYLGSGPSLARHINHDAKAPEVACWPDLSCDPRRRPAQQHVIFTRGHDQEKKKIRNTHRGWVGLSSEFGEVRTSQHTYDVPQRHSSRQQKQSQENQELLANWRSTKNPHYGT